MADAIVSKPNAGPSEDDVMTPAEVRPARKPRASKPAKDRKAARKPNTDGIRTFSGAKRIDN